MGVIAALAQVRGGDGGNPMTVPEGWINKTQAVQSVRRSEMGVLHCGQTLQVLGQAGRALASTRGMLTEV